MIRVWEMGSFRAEARCFNFELTCSEQKETVRPDIFVFPVYRRTHSRALLKSFSSTNPEINLISVPGTIKSREELKVSFSTSETHCREV